MSISKLRKVFLGVPGLIVLGMTSIWLLPFWVRDLLHYPLIKYWNSHLLYAILLGTTILTMLVFNILQSVRDSWNQSGIMIRILSICSGYTIAMIIGFIFMLYLSSVRVLDYFGGDPEGSISMAIIPSVILYWVIGIVIGYIADADI